MSYEQTCIFHVSVGAILDFYTLYCFDNIYFYFFECLIPKNLGVDTKMNNPGAIMDFSSVLGGHFEF